VYCLAVSTDGRQIAAGTSEGDVLVWDAGTRKQVFSYKEDSTSSSIHAVDFSPDSTRLVTASSNCVASVLDIATRQRVLLLPHNKEVIAAKYSPQGDRIVIATQDHVRVYDYINHRFLVDIRVKVIPLFNNGLLWFSDHLFVISNERIKQFEASTGSIVSEWPVPGTNEFSCISLPNHGKFIAYSTDRTVMFWDTLTDTRFTPIQHPQEIRSISFSPDDRYLAIGGKEGKVQVWQVKNGKQMAGMKPRGTVYCLAVSVDGRQIAAGTAEGHIFIWDMETRKQVFSHNEDNSRIHAVDFSPDSTRLVTASSNYNASVWDIATRQRVLLLPHDRAVLAAKYSSQGDRIVIATQDHKIKRFEASTGAMVSEWPVHDSSQSSCISLPKHGNFMAYSTNRTVTLWDTLTRNQISVIQRPHIIRSIAFSPDDRYLAIG
ncbi:WD40-repeat-containing domain protein, partial [Boletus edulis BED1]